MGQFQGTLKNGSVQVHDIRTDTRVS